MSPKRKRTKSDDDQQVITDEVNNENSNNDISTSQNDEKIYKDNQHNLLRNEVNKWFREESLNRTVSYEEMCAKANDEHRNFCLLKECDFKANGKWVRAITSLCRVFAKTRPNGKNHHNTKGRHRIHENFIQILLKWYTNRQKSDSKPIVYTEALSRAIKYHTEYCEQNGCFFIPDKLFIIQFKRKFNLFLDKENKKSKKELNSSDDKNPKSDLEKHEKHRIIKENLLKWIKKRKEADQDFTFTKAQITRTAKDFHRTYCGERCWKKIKKFFQFLRDFFNEHNVSYSFDLPEVKNSTTEQNEDQKMENIEKNEFVMEENVKKDEISHAIIEEELLKWYMEQENLSISKSQITKTAKEIHKTHCKEHCWKKIRTNENFLRFFDDFISKYNLRYSDDNPESIEMIEEKAKNHSITKKTTCVDSSEHQEQKNVVKDEKIHAVFEEKLLEWYNEQKVMNLLIPISRNKFVTTTQKFHKKYCPIKKCISKHKQRSENFSLAIIFMKKHDISFKSEKPVDLTVNEEDEILDCLDSIAFNSSTNTSKMLKNEEIEQNQSLHEEKTEPNSEEMVISDQNTPLITNENSSLISNDVNMTEEPKIDEIPSIPSDPIEEIVQETSVPPIFSSIFDHPEVASALYDWYQKSTFTYRLPFNQLQDIIHTFHQKSCQIPDCDFMKFEICSRWLYRSFYPTYNIDPLPRQQLPTQKEVLDAFDLLIKYFTEEKVTEMEWSLKTQKEIFVKKLQSETKTIE